jgi:hypothetical protein
LLSLLTTETLEAVLTSMERREEEAQEAGLPVPLRHHLADLDGLDEAAVAELVSLADELPRWGWLNALDDTTRHLVVGAIRERERTAGSRGDPGEEDWLGSLPWCPALEQRRPGIERALGDWRRTVTIPAALT